MQTNSQNQYQYDFSYSVTFESLANKINDSPQGLQRQFMEWFQIFSQLQIVNDPQYSKSIYFLFRIPALSKLGINLLSLYNVTHELQNVPQDKQHQLQKCRQSIYTILQQFDVLLGTEKQKYIMLIIVCLFAIIRKTVQNYSKIFNEFQVFHLVYWEIKGQLINKQNMQLLVKKYFDMRQYQRFILLDKDQLTKKPTEIKKVVNANDPLTFRTGVANENKNKKSQMLYQSFKDISLKRAVNKQNEIQNSTFVGQSKYQPQQSPGLNFNLFKKKIQQKYETNAEKSAQMQESKLKFGMLKQNSQRNIQVKYSPRVMKETNNNPMSFRPYKVTPNYK